MALEEVKTYNIICYNVTKRSKTMDVDAELSLIQWRFISDQ